MTSIHRMLIGLAMCAPLGTWAQAAPDTEVHADPQLRWTRSLRPSLELAPKGKAGASASQADKAGEGAGAVLSDASLTARDHKPRKWSILLADKTLYRTMRRWSQEAQFQLLWQIDRDYPIEAEVVFETTLREALAQVMAGVALTDFPLQAIFNPQTRVLRVVRHLEENRR